MSPPSSYYGILGPFWPSRRREESQLGQLTGSEPPAELVERARKEIQLMCQETVEMLTLVARAFRTQSAGTLERAKKLGENVHQREKALTEIVVKRLSAEPGATEANKDFLFVPMHLERVGDNIEFLVRAVKTMIAEGIPFTERAMGEVNTLFEKSIELLECVRDIVSTKNKILIRHIVEEGKRFENKADEFALLHQQRMIEGVCVPKASSMYLAMLDYLRGIESHCRQIGLKLLDQVAA
jgi:Na+/phosphate symporter